MSHRLIGTAAAWMAVTLLACSRGTEQNADTATPAPPAPPTPALSGVVGHWSDTTIDMPALVANGEMWSGQHDRPELEQAGQRLFGTVSDSFIANTSATGAFPFAIAENVDSFSSGTLSARFTMIGGKSDQIAGILFGLRPSGEYYYVRYNTKDGNVALWQFANGERKVIQHGEVHKQLPLGAWHELVVQVRGRNVRGHIAGDTTISVDHTLDVDPVGRVGVWVKRDAITAFRDFRAAPSSP